MREVIMCIKRIMFAMVVTAGILNTCECDNVVLTVKIAQIPPHGGVCVIRTCT